jgi:hypothetical protein
MLTTVDPTRRTYATLQAAVRHFNRALFNGALPPCLVTFQRRAHSPLTIRTRRSSSWRVWPAGRCWEGGRRSTCCASACWSPRRTTDRVKELTKADHAVLLIKAWNAFVRGKTLSVLRARLQPDEPFPQPVKKRGGSALPTPLIAPPGRGGRRAAKPSTGPSRAPL